jgi:hypothetical protein
LPLNVYFSLVRQQLIRWWQFNIGQFMVRRIVIVVTVFSCSHFCYSQDAFTGLIRYQGFIGHERKEVIESFSRTSAGQDWSEDLTGNFYVLRYRPKQINNYLKALQLEFDDKTPTDQTKCMAVTLMIPDTSLLQTMRKLLSSNYPIYDEQNDVYHNEKIGVKVLAIKESNMFYTMFFDYNKKWYED